MNPFVIQELARVEIAERLRQAERARLGREVRAARVPARRLVAGRTFPWLSPWFSSPRGPRTV